MPPHSKKAARIRRPFNDLPEREGDLLGRLLARRVERAGIVDLGDLVVAEAEHLAQDFVGVLAEQRRTGHVARESDILIGLPTEKYLPRVG